MLIYAYLYKQIFCYTSTEPEIYLCIVCVCVCCLSGYKNISLHLRSFFFLKYNILKSHMGFKFL